MSLKHFHFFFIALAALTCLGFGVWALMTMGLSSGFRAMGWISNAIGVFLVVYGIYFFKKSKNLIT